LGITSIQHLPNLPAEGNQVVFNIDYRNNSDQDRFDGVSLEATYVPQLSILHANPLPTRIDASTRTMSWDLGILQTARAARCR
jgi:hypothetical protein